MHRFYITSTTTPGIEIDWAPRWTTLGHILKHIVPKLSPEEQEKCPLMIPAWLDARGKLYHYTWETTCSPSDRVNSFGDKYSETVTAYYLTVYSDEDAVLLKLFFDELKAEPDEVAPESVHSTSARVKAGILPTRIRFPV